MTVAHESRFYQQLAHKKVHCTLCPYDCRIPNNGRGAWRDCSTAIGGLGMSEV
jgi:hypothetical protein